MLRRVGPEERSHPGTAGSPELAGEVPAARIKNPPRLAEHRRREELKYIDDRVPPELAQLLLRFDRSILADRTSGQGGRVV